MELTKQQLHIIRHSLGVGEDGRKRSYRNYYCEPIDSESSDLRTLREMVVLGLMKEGRKINEGRDQYFIVTEQGVAESLKHVEPLPKVCAKSGKMTEKEVEDVAQFLYGLLDDISTIDDIAKGDDVLYRKMVRKTHAKKAAVVATNDGYTITFKPADENCTLLIDVAKRLDCGPEQVGPTLARTVLAERVVLATQSTETAAKND